jgi:hypothetical protein
MNAGEEREVREWADFHESLPRVDQLARTVAQQEAYMIRVFGYVRDS